MIHINRRSVAIEVMNYCEKHRIPYQLQWGWAEQYQLIVQYPHEQQNIEQHIAQWEKS